MFFLYPPPYEGHPQRNPPITPASEMHLRSFFFFLIFIYFGNVSPKTPKKWCFRRCISEVKKIQNREYFGSSFPKTFLHIQFSLFHYFIIFFSKTSPNPLKNSINLHPFFVSKAS